MVACGEGALLLEEIETARPSSPWERGSDDVASSWSPRIPTTRCSAWAGRSPYTRRSRRRGPDRSCVTDGSSTQYPGDEATRAQKEEEARRAAAELGVEDYVHLDLPDMRLDTLAHVEVNGVVEEHVRDLAPETVYTVQPDVNRDHRVLFDSVAVATRPSRASRCDGS